jgi:hypothetical protein
MESFDSLQSIDNFCKVLVKKTPGDESENHSSETSAFPRTGWENVLEQSSAMGDAMQEAIEEPFVDVFDEEDYVRILVQCRCREQEVTFHPSDDGITICREERIREKSGSEKCTDVCRKVSIPTEKLQLDNMLFIIAKCNNNNTLEAMIPKIKK